MSYTPTLLTARTEPDQLLPCVAYPCTDVVVQQGY